MQSEYGQDVFSARKTVDSRARFISRTYNHLFGAIIAFAAIEFALFATGLAVPIAQAMMSVSWLFILGGFMVAGWIASRAAQSAQSLPAQYAALAGYVVIESLIFLPLLVVANQVAPGAISSAGLVTILGFAALGFEGGELASVVHTAMLGDLPWTVLRDFIFPHPGLAESLNNLFDSWV